MFSMLFLSCFYVFSAFFYVFLYFSPFFSVFPLKIEYFPVFLLFFDGFSLRSGLFRAAKAPRKGHVALPSVCFRCVKCVRAICWKIGSGIMPGIVFQLSFAFSFWC